MKFVLYCLLLVLLTGCATRVLVRSERVLRSAQGIMIIPCVDSVKAQDGCLTNGAVLPKVFIPFRFPKGIVSKDDLVKAFWEKRSQRAYFVSLYDDCNGKNTKNMIAESVSLFLKKEVDSVLNNKKIYLLPVIIEYLRDDKYAGEYYLQQKALTLEGDNKTKELLFQYAYFNVTNLGVLEYTWPANFEEEGLLAL